MEVRKVGTYTQTNAMAADTNSQICKAQNTLERAVVRSPEEAGEMREGSTPLRPSRLASQEEMRRCLLRRPAMQHANVVSRCNVQAV